MTTLSIDQLLSIKTQAGAEGPKWSPDGSRILFTSGLGGETDLWTISPSGGFPERLTVGAGEIPFLGARLPQWSPTGAYASYISAKSGTGEVWLWTGRGPDVRLTRLGAQIEAMSWSRDGRAVVLAGNREGSYDIYRVEVPSGATTRLTRDRLYEVYPAFLPDGRIVYVRLNDAWTNHDVVLMNGDGSNPRVILRDTDMFDYHFGRTFGTPQPSPDGRWLLFRSHRSGWFNYYVMPIDGGDPRAIAAAEADQSEAVWSPDGRAIAYVENHNGTVDLRVVAAYGGAASGGAASGGAAARGAPEVLVAPPDGVCSFPDWSPDGTHLCYLLQTTTSPHDLWTVRLADRSATRLVRSVPEWAAPGLVTPEKVTYRTFDGLAINAYLYRPRDAQPKSSPGILWIHGGPTSQYMDTFQPGPQYFAAQGYTVLLPNIRGSSGYGKAFEKLNNKDWGGGDLRDAVAGKQYLATLPWVDAAHTGITGTSYGGCLTMSAVCYAPGEFQAAIAMSGYANWVRLRNDVELRHVKLLEYEFGMFEDDPDAYYRGSPHYKVKDVATPTFVLHGEGKWPWTDASLEFVRALEKEYKAFKYKVYQGENYYVQSTPNVRRMWLDMLDWFDLYLRGRTAPAADHAGAASRGWTGPISRDVAE